MTWHVLTGEYPPSSGGVGDYTRALACELARRGHTVHVWSPAIEADADDSAIRLRALPDLFGSHSRRVLEAAWQALPGIVLLQYVPNALGARGLNVGFCRWLRRVGHSRDVRVMFHEPYFYFSWNVAGNVRAVVQRMMAAVLVQAAHGIYFSTSTWRRHLPSASSRAVVLPVPSTIPRSCDRTAAERFRHRMSADAGEVVGHFGTYGDHVSAELGRVVPLVLETCASAHFLCIGRGSSAFSAALRAQHRALADRIHETGPLSPADVAAAIRACDVMVQPYPDGITTRRTSMMASLTNGVATVSTDGVLTEPVWREAASVALAPAGQEHAIAAKVIELLRDPDERAVFASAGRRMYDAHFAIERSVDALLGA